MCVIDFDGYPEFHATREVTARVFHVCDVCRRIVSPGERYVRVNAKWDGDLISDVCCLWCADDIDEFAAEDGHGRPFPSSFKDFLWECIGGRGDAKWVAMMDRIHDRRGYGVAYG